MDIKDMFNKLGLTPSDVPILELKETDPLLNFFHSKTDENDITFKELSRDTGISYERLLEINNEISLHFKNNLAPKVFTKAMIKTNNGDTSEFEQFFQRLDVDLSCNFLFYITDIKTNLRNLNTPQYQFLFDNWKKYRGY